MTDRETLIARLLTESPLTAAEAARRCGVDVAAVKRWIARGKPSADDTRRRLEAYHAGRGWLTSVEALARFLAGSPRLPEPSPATRTSAGFDRARFEEARRRLKAAVQ